MPSSRSFRRVVLVWLLRAWALRRCWYVIFAAVFSNSRFDAARPWLHQDCTKAATAVWSWHTVSSGFFPPLGSHTGQEQVADGRQDQVSFQSQVAPAFVLIQTDLALVVFETTFHTPSGEGDQQQGADSCLGRCIAHEEFDLGGIQHVACDDQMQSCPWQAVLVLDRDECVLALPYHRSFFPILDAPGLPGLIAQCSIFQQRIDAACRSAATGQPRNVTASTTPTTVKRSCDDAWRLQPTREIPWHLRDVVLLPRRHFAQKLRFAAVTFVERQPVKMQTVADGSVIEFQRDPPLGPVNHRIGNAGFPATLPVRRPTLRQEQLAVEQAVEVIDGVAQMHRDYAVFELTQPTAPLLLHPGRLVALLGVAGLVEDADRTRARVLGPDDLLETITQSIVVPFQLTEELLERSRCDSRRQRDRLDALLGEFGELSTDINSQMSACVLASKTVSEPIQETFEFRFETANLCGIHARSSVSPAEDHSFADSLAPSKVNVAL